MLLSLLHNTPAVAMYYDSANDWLFVDWRGDLDLPMVQAGCLTLAECFLARSYARVLNSNCDVVSMSADVAPWMVHEYLPRMVVAGIEYIAWVCAPSPLAKYVANEAERQLKGPMVATFEDLADAYAWLSNARPTRQALPPTAAWQSRLRERVATLSDELARYQQVSRLVVTPARGLAA